MGTKTRSIANNLTAHLGSTSGNILQVVRASSTTQVTLGQSDTTIITSSITPKASNSTLLLIANLQVYLSGTGSYHSNVEGKLYNDTDSTVIQEGFSVYQGYGGGTADLGNIFLPMIGELASWGTTSKDIYVRARRPEPQGAGVVNQYGGLSYLTIFEIGA